MEAFEGCTDRLGGDEFAAADTLSFGGAACLKKSAGDEKKLRGITVCNKNPSPGEAARISAVRPSLSAACRSAPAAMNRSISGK